MSPVGPERPSAGAAVRTGNASAPGGPAPKTWFCIDLRRSGSDWVRAMLRDRFPDQELAWIYESNEMPGAISVEMFQALSEAAQGGLRAVMGSFAFGLHKRPGPWFSYFTVVRDPIERAHWLHRDYLRLAGQRGGRVTTLDDFIFGQQHLTVDNGYVRAIAGRRHVRFGQCTDELYDEALEHIERRFSALLLHDQLAKSAAIVAHLIDLEAAEMPLAPNSEAAEEPALGEIDGAVLERLRRLNRLDLRLYDYARERFDATYTRLIG